MKIGICDSICIISALIGGAIGDFSGFCIGALVGAGICTAGYLLKGAFWLIVKILNYKEE